MVSLFQRFFILLCLISCSGYKMVSNNNPLAQYEIKKISVPTFINHSSFSGVGGPFSQEIALLLGQYKGLEVVFGDSQDAEGVLIGIIHSEDSLRKAMKAMGPRLAQGIDGNLTGKRQDFYVPSYTMMTMRVQLILIKRPTPEEIEILTSELGKYIPSQNKIIFNEFLAVSGVFTREMNAGDNGVVNSTMSRGAQDRVIGNMAKEAARQFRDTILNAF